MVIKTTSKNFEEVISSNSVVIVDFYANWCGPCRMLSPILEKVESDIKVIKVDVDVFENLAREYGVMSIPTILLLENGIETKRNIGFIDKERLEKFIN